MLPDHPHSRDKVTATTQPGDALRGCSLASLVWHRSLLRSSEDCADAYKVSASVNSIDIFLSHAWSDCGWRKQAALLTCCIPAVCFNATVISSIVGVWLHCYLSYKWYELIVLLIGFVSFIVSIITLLLVKHRNTTVFLDKCCINQADFAEKMRGISRLSDYLRASDKLIVLWTPNYLDRLWCVYELAVFMRTHDKKDVIILNFGHVKLCLYLLLLQLLGVASICFVQAHSNGATTHVGYKLLLSGGTTFLVGRQILGGFQDWGKFLSKLNTFSMRNAKCTSPDDYTKLKQLINNLYGSEDHFVTCVRGLCLGSPDERPASLWLFSKDALRVCSVPYIPIIVCAIGKPFGIFVRTRTAMVQICPGQDNCKPPSLMMEMLWSLRANAFQAIFHCLRVPCMVTLGHKLATRVHSEQSEHRLLVTLCYCIIFVLYSHMLFVVYIFYTVIHLIHLQ